MIFILRERIGDRILPGFAINSAGIRQLIHNSLEYQYADYSRIDVKLQNSEAAVLYSYLDTIRFDIIILEQVVIEND
jgi:hypothetical protein